MRALDCMELGFDNARNARERLTPCNYPFDGWPSMAYVSISDPISEGSAAFHSTASSHTEAALTTTYAFVEVTHFSKELHDPRFSGNDLNQSPAAAEIYSLVRIRLLVESASVGNARRHLANRQGKDHCHVVSLPMLYDCLGPK